MLISGLDIGTTGCKISLYNENGESVYTSYSEYASVRNSELQEINPIDVWESVKKVIYDAKEKAGKIDAIGVTSFGESFVLLDENDNVLTNSMLYTDKRGQEQAKRFDKSRVIEIAGAYPNGMYSLPKVMWIKENKPEIYAKAKRILLYQDYIVYMLSGVAQIDYSLAARTMAFDIKNKCWSKELFDFAEIDMDKFAKPVCAGTVAGKSTLPGLEDTVIVTACHDQLASLTGAGVFELDTAVDGTGTVECITPIFGSIPDNEEFYKCGYTVVPHIFENKYMCYALTFTGGAAIKWFKDTFAPDESYKELDSKVGDKPSGIFSVPHYAGSGTPYMNENATATISGVHLGTTKYDLYRGIMEGVAYEMKLNLDTLEKENIVPKTFYATGGGAKSKVWLQMKADIWNREVTALEADEVGAVGTIMLTAVAIGVIESLEKAREKFVKQGKTYVPNKENVEKYKPLYEQYLKVRP